MFERRFPVALLFVLFLFITFALFTPVYSQTCTDNDGDGYFSQGGACGPADCDDNDPNVKPGAAEICDGKDSNCDGWKPSTDIDADGDGVPKCKSDCDDNNPNRYPGKAEICDGIDNDCNNVVPTNEKDNDLDGYRVCQGDCVDTNAAINPGVNESGTAMCSDTKDNDCDGLIDNNDPPCQTCTDNDGDGYGNPGSTFCTVGSATDCNDNNAAIKPNAVEVCNGIDDNCSGAVDEGFDADGDGFTTCNGDCNDANATIKPTAAEVCDGIDNNCNSGTDEGFDADADGYTTCQGDCDDTRAGVNPGAAEIPYNGLNDDCNPATPDNDLDGDGYFSPTDCNDNNAGINPGATDIPYDGIDQDCSGADFADVDGDGYDSTVVAGGDDCDDNNAAINPSAADAVCNGADENCNGANDEQYVATATNCGEGECATTGVLECQLGVLVDNCTPLAPGVEGPANDPTCSDGLDNNCDGLTDDPNDPNCITICEDKDGDGVGVGADCVGQTDCNDNNAAIKPGAAEVCNGTDDNCSGSIDEGFNQDSDGYTTCGGDCNDNNANINPGAAEIPYDGIDQNCNGSDLRDVDGDGYNSTAVAGGTDCNDNNANINPGKAEIPYDGIDQNCSGADLTDVDVDGYNSTAVAGGTDCNDSNANINPGKAEVCNAKDDNCNGSTDEGFDADGDGYTTCNGDCDDTNANTYPGAFEQCDGRDNNCDGTSDVDADHDGYPVCNPLECNDNDANINPGKTELCNRKDDNCNGSTDEGFDADGDGYTTCNGDCDDTNANVKPGAVDICDGKDTNCDGWKSPTDVDKDGDGVPVCANDCDDNNPLRYPGKAEVCDGVDNDCNNIVPTNEKDTDGDGYRPCDVPGDCKDNDANVNPGLNETGTAMCSDAKDNDCDGLIDNNDPPCQTCTDNDGDGYGNPGSTFCPSGSATDCNDNNAAIKPNAVEVCNGIDDNCSNTIDEGFDADHDGFTVCGGDCNDANATIKPNAVEVCNGVDENCNGTIDDGFDVDGDGYTTCNGDCDDTRAGVNPGSAEIPYNGLNDDCNPATPDNDLDGDGYSSPTDCNDNNAGINPGASDIPYDGIDQDCSGADFADVDGDGYNSTAVAGGDDCDDNNAAINPSAADAVCNGADENCNGTNDEQYVATATNCGVGQCAATGQRLCQLGVLVDSCTPLAPGVEGPANDPTCNDGLDNNCDGLTDDPNDPNCITICEDKDGDGVGVGADCVGQTDCNDNNAAIKPGAVEVCNGTDDNCNGTTDEGFNLDGDGYTTCGGDCNDNNANINPGVAEVPYDGIDQNCSGADLTDVDGDGHNSTVVAGGTDCNDNNANINPGKAEIPYDGIDQNCSGADLTDVDGDGHNSTAVAGGTDCNDNNAAINPAAVEVCNAKDDNCNGSTDEGFDADGDNYKTCTGDCDDTNPNTYPGAFEQCDGKDNNCDGTSDADADHDGYPVCNPLECNDNDPNINPGKAEACNGKDDNCNGSTDEGFDADGDGYTTCNGDCDDTDARVKPGAVDICDGKDTNCDGWKSPTDVDKDGDGVPVCASDCDDNNPLRYPGKAEVCDGVDNDCNSIVPTNEKDTDGDGYRPCDTPGDCNDSNAALNPGVAEVGALCIDNKDNDCDGLTDVNDLGCAAYCVDNDSDGYGNPGNANCANGVVQDCNDNNVNINPGKAETCNGIDDNCNGTTDEGFDVDGDGYKTCTGDCNDNSAAVNPGRTEVPYNGIDDDCKPSTKDDDLDADGYPIATDCNDGNANINPGKAEVPYDGIDQNCNGADLTDVDGDGHNSIAVAGGTDCNDNNANINPAKAETCNSIDDNCNGNTDEGFDADSDGVTTCAGDCDDNNAAVKPGAPDAVCDGVDNNCNGTPDDAYTATPTSCGIGICASTGQRQCQTGVFVDTCSAGAAQTEGPSGNATCSDGLDNDCDGLTDNPADGDCVNACVDTDNDGYGSPGHPDCANGIALDCINNNAAIHPGAVEVCNAKDDNCDGTTDEGFDTDGDGYTTCGGDCNDSEAGIKPNAVEIPYDGIDQNCNGTDLKDVDGDGYNSTAVAGGTDCNDNNVNINPSKAEIPYDGIDQNCNGTDLTDVDVDGYNSTAVAGGTDCNDNNANINPGKAEVCNGIDDNCSGSADEGFNADGDGYTTCGGDCDDTNANTYPGAFEQCDGRDNNCDGTSDVDADHDGFPACNPLECNDNNANINPGKAEACNNIDDNCNGSIDEGFDADGDTYTSCGGDCDDTDPKVKPGAAEICDGKDSNCDGWKSPTDRDTDHDGVPLCASDCNDNDPLRYPGNCEICNDLVDNDCDTKVDASDSECQYTCNTKTTPKNGPHMFDLQDQATGATIKTSCNWCHYDGTGAIDERYLCQRCHADPADASDPMNGSLKALYPMDPPYGFQTAPNVKMHSSSVVGTKYGAWGMSCLNCHNPHTQEQDNKCGNSNDYGKLIKEYVCYDNAATGGRVEETIQFTSGFGAGSFADGAPNERNICEMCHTQTNHHQNNGLAPGDFDAQDSYIGHYDGNTCTNCHSHAEGFKPSCGGCHEVPPPTGTHLKHFGGTKEDAVYGNTGITQDAGPQGAVYLMNCGNCHPMDITRHYNNVPNSGGGSAEIELYNPNAPAGSLKALNTPAASYTPGTTVYTDSKGLQYTNGTCNNVYCHSNTVVSTSAEVPQPSPQSFYPPLVYDPPWEGLIVQSRQYQEPVWGVDSLGCDGCHGYPIMNQYPAVSAGAGDSHGWTDNFGNISLHVWNMGFDPLQCNTCHYDTVRDDAAWQRDEYSIVFNNIPIFNTSKHVNGSKDITFNPAPVLYQAVSGDVYHDLSSASFDSNTKTCNNVACHLYQTEVKWGTPYRWRNSIECNVCHQY